MKYLIDFLKSKTLNNNYIYKELGCSLKEAKILQFMLKEYISGNDSMLVLDLLGEFYSNKNYQYLDNLNIIKNILELGWVYINIGDNKAFGDFLKLKILNSTISLSDRFLKLVESGKIDSKLPDKKEYSNNLEYLKDQFMIVDLYEQIARLKEQNSSNTNINRLKNRLCLIEKRVTERVKVTNNSLYLRDFFKNNDLDQKEQIIFLTLLKEEYSGKNDDYRDMNYLIDIVSFDEYDRIQNRTLLEDNSKLLKNRLIDYDEILNPFGGINRRFFILEDILYKISHPKNQESNKIDKIKIDDKIKKQNIFEYFSPKSNLENVILNNETKDTLYTLIKNMDKKVVQRLKKWGISDKKSGLEAKIIFYGVPGTGKTLTAHSLAKSLNKKVLSFDCSKILSQYVGESEKNVRNVFDTYYDLVKNMKNKPLFLLDEADQFLGQRTSNISSGSEKMYNQMQNIFLEQIEKFDGILVATTNMLENIDSAFSRRFNYKIEFKKPTNIQREKLWMQMLPKNCNLLDVDIKQLAKYELTGGQIKLVIKNTSYKVATKSNPKFKTVNFTDEINKELKGSFESCGQVGFFG